MVALDLKMRDPTLEAMDAVIEKREADKPVYHRNLGASLLGDDCERKIYFHINQVPKQPAKAALIYAGEDGYLCENIIANRLRLISGIELWTHNEEGKQFGFKDYDGRLKGYADGVILGLLQSPKTPHVWENKAKSAKRYAGFLKIKDKFDDKEVLKNWEFGYYVQAQLLMGYLDLTRHYCTVCEQGGRVIESCRTDFDKEFFFAQQKKAERLFGMKSAPERITSHRGHFKCRMCDFEDHCWGLDV